MLRGSHVTVIFEERREILTGRKGRKANQNQPQFCEWTFFHEEGPVRKLVDITEAKLPGESPYRELKSREAELQIFFPIALLHLDELDKIAACIFEHRDGRRSDVRGFPAKHHAQLGHAFVRILNIGNRELRERNPCLVKLFVEDPGRR
jgi:hypothetical protein